MEKIKIKAVYPANDLNIIVVFTNGIIKRYDVKQLFSQFDWYQELNNPDLFQLVKVDCGGCGVAWNEDIDISEYELWENSEPYISPFEGLMSFAEAAERWHIDDSTLRKAVSNGRLVENIDIKKFGKQWVVTEKSMHNIFGDPK